MDPFLRWQLAGDEFEPDNPQAVAATGFLTAAANTPAADAPGRGAAAEPLQRAGRYALDGRHRPLGLTLGCARCHDHKYDAISSREYYRLLCSLHSGERRLRSSVLTGHEALVFQRPGWRARTTWLFGRGDFYDRDQAVQLGFLEILLRDRTAEEYWSDGPQQVAARATRRYQRTALANWVTDVEHGAGALAARVLVNRIWQHHFGDGLVRTVSDFGVAASRRPIPSCSNGWPQIWSRTAGS